MKSYIIVLAMFFSAFAAWPQSVEVSYQQKRATVQLRQVAHEDVSAKGHDGVARIFSCVPIKDVLSTVQPPSGDKLRGPGMSLIVVAEAKDDYRAAFALAELDESVGGKQAFVCDKQDGRPLADSDGPLRLVVPSDKRPARWVRMLTALDIRNAQP
jgi:hypothetical protein